MYVLQSSTEFLMIPVTGPQADLTGFAVSIALKLPPDGEPADTDYVSAQWLNGEAALLYHKGDYAAATYKAFVRVVAPPEDVRLYAGLVRVGDARS